MFSEQYDQLKSYYDEGRFVAAYHETEEHWSRPGLVDELPSRDLVLAARLAFRLGGGKYGRWMLRIAAKKFPDEQEVKYYAFNYIYRHRSAYTYLESFDKNPVTFESHPDLQAYTDAKVGYLWSQFRDFEQSHRYFDKALSYDTDDFWINSLHSGAILAEDRIEEALELARHAWNTAKGQPAAIDAVDAALCRQEKFEEAAEFITAAAEKSSNIEARISCCSRLVQVARRETPEKRERWLRPLRSIGSNLEEFAPLADRSHKVIFARIRLETAMLADDFSGARAQIKLANHPYYSTVLENQANTPDGRRVIIPHKPVRQEWQTCLPASISAVLSAFDDEITQQEIASDNTYSGTSVWLVADWLRGRGYAVHHFVFSPEAATQLLDLGIPFVLHEAYETSGHSVAAVGYDARLGVLLVHDPSLSRLREPVMESLGKDEKPVGPFCTIILPQSHARTDISFVETRVVELYQQFFKEKELHGINAAGEVLAELQSTYPEHPICRYLHAIHLVSSGQGPKAYESLHKQYLEYPKCVYFRRLLLSVCREMNNSAKRREILSSVVLQQRLPGQEQVEALSRVSPPYLCDYADCLSSTHDTLPEARRAVMEALRNDSSYAHSYHILSDIYLWWGKYEERVFPGRIAAVLEPSDNHYAWTCFDSLRRTGRLEDGLAYLKKRAREWGVHPHGGGAWNLYIDELEDAGRPAEAMEEMQESLKLFPDDPQRIEFACGLLRRMGRWDEAEDCLARLESSGSRPRYYLQAVNYYFNKGEWQKALALAEEWMQLESGNEQARSELLRLASHANGELASLQLARKWHEESPENEELEGILLSELECNNKKDERIELLRSRVKRNPFDAWAWRAIGFRLLSDASHAAGAEQAELLKEAVNAKEECSRLCPGWPVAVMDSLLAEINEDYESAVAHLMAALDDDPDYSPAYKNICELSRHMPIERQKVIFGKLFKHSLRTDRGFDFDYIYTIAARLGLGIALIYINRIEEYFPDNPLLVELRADVLLRYGRGTNPEKVPEADPGHLTQYLREAVQRYPAYGGLRLSLANVLNLRDLTEDGISVLENHLKITPMDRGARRILADLLENSSERDKAEEILEKSIELFPSEPGGYDDLAGLLMRSGEYERAIETILGAHEKMPENVWLYERCIYHLNSVGRFAEALEVARRGTEVYPKGSYMWSMYGDALGRLGDDPEAVESAYRESLRLNPAHFDAADSLSYFLSCRKRYAEALEMIEPFTSDPRSAVSANGRKAWLLREKGDTKEAYRVMEANLQISPGYSWGWCMIIEWMSEDKENDRALRLLAEIPDAMRYDGEFRGDRIMLLDDVLKNKKQLKKEWDLLLNDFPDNIQLYLQGFDSFYEGGNKARAREVLEHIEERFPHNSFIVARRFSLLVEEGKRDEALNAARGVWSDPGDHGNWPDNHVWKIAEKDGLLNDAAANVAEMIRNGRYVRPPTLMLLATSICDKENRKILQHVADGLGVKLPLTKGRAKIIGELLSRLRTGSNFPDGLESALDGLCSGGESAEVLKFYQGNEEIFNNNAGLISSAVVVLADAGHWDVVYEMLKDWRNLKGMNMWLTGNYVISIENVFADHEARVGMRQEVIEVCTSVLQNANHDHGAWFVVALLLEEYLADANYDAFCSAYKEFDFYASRKPAERGEIYQSGTCWHTGVFNDFASLILCDSKEQADRAIRRIAKKSAELYRAECEPKVKDIMQLKGFTYKRPKVKIRKEEEDSGNGLIPRFTLWLILFFIIRALFKLFFS